MILFARCQVIYVVDYVFWVEREGDREKGLPTVLMATSPAPFLFVLDQHVALPSFIRLVVTYFAVDFRGSLFVGFRHNVELLQWRLSPCSSEERADNASLSK